MTEIAQATTLHFQHAERPNMLRHSLSTRITHWINTLAFVALVISGAAILLAHPRLYWGETGAFGSPALIELPLPLNLDQSGWGRSLHFLSAWVCVVNGALYFFFGIASGHFATDLTPARSDLAWTSIRRRISDALSWRKPNDNESMTYNVLQRLSYLVVVFILFPVMILTGLAMSPAVTSVLPIIVEVFGGYQSSRTIHFFVMNILVLFLVIHVAMICLAGFRSRMRGMITGDN
jgi:thiosulfate reductase cytochrome b subunit